MKQMLIYAVGLVFSMNLSCLLPLSQSTHKEEAKTIQEENIREAIVRYQIATWDLNAKVYFISINGKDPSHEFLSRFKDVRYSVMGKSASKRMKDVIGWVVEKKTKKLGVIFDQESIRWLNDAKVDVAGGYLCGGLCMAGGMYHLELRNDQWTVTSFNISIQS
jgi:hypothetical protein